MKRRSIFWIAGILTLLAFTRCHFVAPPMRRADAVITVKTTGYCACPKCSGWKFNWIGLPVSQSGAAKGIGQTSGGRMARPGIVAADPKIFPQGTKFYISGYGWGRAEDVGGIKGAHLDLYFWQHSNAQEWGEQTKKIKVWYPKK
jgi:3D (Asp-Asp-Asp) domain-containing protein